MSEPNRGIVPCAARPTGLPDADGLHRERRWGPLVFWRAPATHPTADLEKAIALLGLAGLVALWGLPLPTMALFAGHCRFRELTGIPCLTCGTTRALLALGAGRVFTALRENPLLTLGIGFGAAYTPVAWFLWLARRPRPRFRFASRRAGWAALGLAVFAVLAQWVFLFLDGR